MADFTDKVAKARAAGYSDDEIVQFLSSGEMSAKIKKAQDAGYSSGDIVSFLGNAPQAPSGPRDASTALTDPEWAKKGRTLYKESNAQDFQGSDEEAAKWLNNYLYDFNYRLAGVGADNARGTLDTAAQISGYSDEGKKAFVDAQTQFENMNTTLGGMGEAAKRVFTDPTTYIGLGTFGVGTGVAQGAKQVAKKGVVELAKIGAKRAATRGAAIGAAEGATYGAVSDLGQQQAMVNAGGQEAIDPMQTAQVAGLSGLTGGVLGGAVGGASGFIRGRNPTVKAAQQIAENGDEAVMRAEVAKRFSDASDVRGSQLSKEDATAIINKEYKSPLMKALNESEYADKQQLMDAVDRYQIVGKDELDALRNTPQGAQTADVIMQMKRFKDYGNPVSSDKGWRKAARIALDVVPTPGIPKFVITKAQELLRGRQNSADVIADLISPKNRKVADEVLRLGGKSKASQGRQALLDEGLRIARARQDLKVREAAAKAESKARFEQARLDRVERANKARADRSAVKQAKGAVTGVPELDNWFSDPLNKARVDAMRSRVRAAVPIDRQRNQSFQQNVRTNTGLGRQQNREVEKQARDQTSAFEGALNNVNAKMRMQQRLDNQRISELSKADAALAKLEADNAVELKKKESAFNAALAKTRGNMKSAAALQKFKERMLAKEAKSAPGLPPSGASLGLNAEAPKPVRSRKYTKSGKKVEEPKQTQAEMAFDGPTRSSGVGNPIAYQAGTDTIMDFQRRALDAASRNSDKKVGDILQRAVEDMILAKDNQVKRQEAYNKAADAALEISPDAFEFIDKHLYFLVSKYADK